MSRLSLALAGLIIAAVPAAADVTPREVWDDWLGSLQESDSEITTRSVDETGDRLVVTGLSIVSGTEAEGRYTLDVDEVSLVQNADGTVGVTVSPAYPIVLSGTDEDGDKQETHLLVEHPDFEMTISEEGGTRQHDFSAPQVRISIVEALENGEPLDLTGGLTLNDATGRYEIGAPGEGHSVFSAASIAFDLAGAEPESDEKFKATIGMQDFDSTNMLQMLGMDTAATARGLPSGTSFEGGFTSGATTFRVDSEADGQSSSLSGTTGPAETKTGLSADGLDYLTEASEVSLAFSGSSVPLPEVTFGIGEATLLLAVPILASEEPQPYAFGVSLREVALDDGLWNMVDPAGILPRDPGMVVVDVSGDIAVEKDVDARAMTDDATDEIRTLNLNTVRVALADAKAEAAGNLTMTEMPEGTTLPVGEIDVTLTGAARLLDRLVQVGIVPKEQAMGTRMMLTMFARPGATEEELVSTIRLTEDGHVYVNEQQVR